MQLNFKVSENTHPPLIILHGLLGMLDNWKSVGKELEEHFKVFLLDQRNHGKSPHTDQHSYKLLADDLAEFFEQQAIAKASVLGHSMGGKTAMRFALEHPQLIDKLIVVDMGIKQYPAGHDKIFDALHAVDLNKITSRTEADSILSEKINDKGVRQFLLKNMTRNADGSYSWKFNLEGLYKNYEGEITAPIVSQSQFTGQALFIRGENSDYILDEDWEDIKKIFPKAKLVTIKNAGHWVHADQQEALVKTVTYFLSA